MSTTYYNLPTINGTDTVDGVNAINGLANATDAALRQVANTIPDLSTLNAQVATLTQQVGSAQTTASNAATAASQANTAAQSAQGTASSAMVTASEAAAKLTVKPKLTGFPTHGATEKQTAGTIDSNFVVNELSQMVTVKVYMNNAAFNLAGGNTTIDNPLVTLGTIPEEYRATSAFEQLIFVGGSSAGKGVCLFYMFVDNDGRVGIYHTNYTTDAVSSFADIYGTGIIAFFYGAETA